MSGVNHVAGGVVFTGIYLSLGNINIFSSPSFLFFTAFFALLPDIDHTSSIIGKPFYPISKYLDRKFGHRTITHSLIVYIALIMVVKIFELIITGGNTITHIFIWAYASHLILDMLTVKGIPLFYPFKKNPCVIPGNPKYRFRSTDFKAEAMVFGIFIMLTFSLQDLFANGFWNTYNRTWDSVKALHTEKLLYSKLIKVNYNFDQKNVNHKGTAVLVDADLSKAILFDKGFYTIGKEDRITSLVPVRTQQVLTFEEQFFTNISFDSLQKLIRDKPILSIKLQSTLPIHFVKDHTPQSSNNVELEYAFNPVFQSNDIDSIDRSTERELISANEELSQLQDQINLESLENASYEKSKKEAFAFYDQLLKDVNGNDLAAKERAIKELPSAQNKVAQFNKPKLSKRSTLTAIQTKIEFLKSKLHIKQQQQINGFISYFKID